MNDDALERHLRDLASAYPEPGMALVPALRWLAGEDAATAAKASDFEGRYGELLTRTLGLEAGQVHALLEVHGASLLSQPATGARLCMGLSCYLQGAGAVRDQLRSKPDLFGTEVEIVHECLGHCHLGPAAIDASGHICKIAPELISR